MKKWILFGLAIILLGTAGVSYYLLEVKEYDTADENVEEMVTGEYDVKLPTEETDISTDEELVTTPTESTDVTPENSESSDNTNSDTNEAGQKDTTQNNSTTSSNNSNAKQDQKENSSEKEASKTPTAKSITDKYKPSFLALEDQANSKINSLVSYAADEYSTKKQNGEDISYFYFYAKYSRAGTALEIKTDEAFNYLYNALVDELVENGFDVKEAKPFKEAYESAKVSRRNALLDKAKSYLN